MYESDGVELPSGDIIRNLTYGEMEMVKQYLAVMENCNIDHGLVQEKVASEYKHSLKLILSSQLCGNYKFKAINSFAFPVLRYSAAIVQWPVHTLKALDRQTRKLLTLFQGLHPKSDVNRRYLPHKLGGRGLLSCEDIVHEEHCSLFYFVQQSSDELTIELKKSGLLCECETVNKFRSEKLHERLERYKHRSLHGYYERVCGDVINQASTFYWLNKGDLSIESEGFLMAAQEQSLPTRAMTQIHGTCPSALCCLCGEHPETVEHLISGCPKLASQSYKY